MELDIYKELIQVLNNKIDNLDSSLWGLLIKKNYKVSAPFKKDFENLRETITITYSTQLINSKQEGFPVIASIKKGRNNGLDGWVYEHADRKAAKQIKETIHLFAHKYNISTGNLLL